MDTEKTSTKATARTEPENFVWSRKRDTEHSESGASVCEDLETCITEINCAPPEQLNEPTDMEIQNVNHVFANIDCDCENDKTTLSQHTQVSSPCSSNTAKKCDQMDQDIKKGNLQGNGKLDCVPQTHASSDGNVSRMKVEYLKQLIEGKLDWKAREKIIERNGTENIRLVGSDSTCTEQMENDTGSGNLSEPKCKDKESNVVGATIACEDRLSSERIVSPTELDTRSLNPDAQKTDSEGCSRNIVIAAVPKQDGLPLSLTTTNIKTEVGSFSAVTDNKKKCSSQNFIDLEKSKKESKQIDLKPFPTGVLTDCKDNTTTKSCCTESASETTTPTGYAANDQSSTQQGNEEMVLFKVKRKDVVKFDMGEGRVIYILDIAEVVSDDARV
jgi:hypothetical protein